MTTRTYECLLCDWRPRENDDRKEASLRQHFTIMHKKRHPQDLECVEMTCHAWHVDHLYGESMCSYTFDPVEGLLPKEYSGK